MKHAIYVCTDQDFPNVNALVVFISYRESLQSQQDKDHAAITLRLESGYLLSSIKPRGTVVLCAGRLRIRGLSCNHKVGSLIPSVCMWKCPSARR